MTFIEHKEKLSNQLADLREKIVQGEKALAYMTQQAHRLEGAIAILSTLLEESEGTKGSLSNGEAANMEPT